MGWVGGRAARAVAWITSGAGVVTVGRISAVVARLWDLTLGETKAASTTIAKSVFQVPARAVLLAAKVAPCTAKADLLAV